MKFATGLIKIFSGMLAACVFCAFLYYTYQYQITKEADNLFTANLALIVFLISSVSFALLFVLFDVYQNKNNESDLVKLLKGSDLNKNTENSNITDLLVKIASFNNQTNQLLDHRLTEINKGLSSLSNNSEVNGNNFQTTLEQLTTICGDISQYVDNIKNDNAKEIQRNAGHSGNIDVLVATVSHLSSDLNSLNGRLLDVVNQISKNVTESIQSHTNIDNEIKDLLQKILISQKNNSLDTSSEVLPKEVENSSDNKRAPEAEEEENVPAPQSVADFYDERFKDIKKNSEESSEPFAEEMPAPEPFAEEAPAPEEVTEDSEILQENEQRIDDLITTPEQPETFAPQQDDLTETQEDAIVEQKADEESDETEAREPWNTPLSEEIIATEQKYENQQFDENPVSESPVSESPVSESPVSESQTAENQTLSSVEFSDNAVAENNFAEPVQVVEPTLQPPSSSEDFKNEPYFEQPAEPLADTISTLTDNDFSLEANDPFNPSPEHFEDFKFEAQNPAEKPISLDLQDEEPVSEDLPSNDSNVKLDEIFNSDFASEMADLDILKDNNLNSGEISVEDLLADDNDPYNPDKQK